MKAVISFILSISQGSVSKDVTKSVRIESCLSPLVHLYFNLKHDEFQASSLTNAYSVATCNQETVKLNN